MNSFGFWGGIASINRIKKNWTLEYKYSYCFKLSKVNSFPDKK